MLSGLEENMVACTFITTGAYIAGNVTSSAYPAGYGRAQDYPHVSTTKTAAFYDAWLLVQQCCTMKQGSCSCWHDASVTLSVISFFYLIPYSLGCGASCDSSDILA